MKAIKLFLLLFILVGVNLAGVTGQDVQSVDDLQKLKQEITQLKLDNEKNKPGTSKFLLRGYAHSGFQLSDDKFSFVGGSFNPLFIYKQSNKLLFESELEMELVGGEVELNVEYANMSYLLSDNLTLRAGKILVPFGIFVPNLHPAWINKFPSMPQGVGHGGVIPTNDIGIELRGGAYFLGLKYNYSFYAVNGAQLNEGDSEAHEAGKLKHAIFPDNNLGKTFGSRIGIFPFSNSNLEIGFSGMYGKVGSSHSDYEDIAALHYAFDLSFVKTLPAIKSVLDVKGQYNAINIDDANYPIEDEPNNFVTFDNNSTAWFAQVSLRPALLDIKVIRNLEFAGRYSSLTTPIGSGWETDNAQIDLGINYWVDWRTLIKFSYRISKGGEEDDHGEDEPVHGEEIAGNAFFIHWAIGF